MSKQVCMVVGCGEHASEHVELVTTEATVDKMEIWTDVHICQSCESLLSDYFADKPIRFDGLLVDDISVSHETPNREGFAECIAVWLRFAEVDDDDEFDALNIGLFDKEPFHIDGALVDVEAH